MERIISAITRELNTILINEDLEEDLPPFCSVKFAKVSKDLSIANVHVSAGTDAGENARCAEILNRHSHHLRSLLASRLNLRRTPALKFHADMLEVDAARLNRLIDAARSSDPENA